MASTNHSGVNYGAQVGVNYGSFTADFHLPSERPETPPSPLSTVPFTRDPDFVSRDTLLLQIQEKSSVQGSRIALVGLGGVGKSQLAIEYSYQARSQSRATWVFWVHASSVARFEQSFRDIADQVKISGRQNLQINIFKLVENWLRDEKKGKWILILDNIDDDVFLRKPPATGPEAKIYDHSNAPTKPLLEYLPRSLCGSILITSRTREVALKMVDYKDLIEVKPMEDSEALELLQRKLDLLGESQESQQLVKELEFMPLAIVQAASYIQKLAPRCSVSQYLRDFQKSDREAIRLLKNEAGHLYRDWEAKNSILVTWQISFDHIRQTKPSAADLLSLMSFFDPQGIPENLVRLQPETNCKSSSELLNDSSDGETSGSDVGDDFEDDITTLRDYSFISLGDNSALLTMHRLVQLTMRIWLKTHGRMGQWREKFISNLYQEFPTGQYKNWEKCRSLFPHVRSAMSQRPESQKSLIKWAILLYRGAWYASESGNIADVREMAAKSRKQMVKLLGADDETALKSTAMLATAYSLEGRWEEAEKLDVQVMETRTTKLGEDHLDTLTSMDNLALTYWDQGRWDEAEQLQAQVTKTRKTRLGEDHPDTLTSMNNLAMTYWKQARWEGAEQLQVLVMETRKTKLGEDHLDTLTSMDNLAFTWKSSGHNAQALNLLRNCLAKRKQKLGLNHPKTLSTSETLLEWETQQLNINA
ncbi:hypothetical protein N7508_006478 [Penicillium antarcticum]|uniref:uncharacterized protein n=1 Tax=Penicillium antarcticum TaxID=416450 RepID=UPI00239F5EE0|nr:uncharacterized protein N7508_006478 [Penicillium antarcticum]KAJ5301615.1 hypothetical protein N7508_006478 [Penicillium antarcticum]